MTTRYSCKIRPVHADGSDCTHKVRLSGKPLDPECPGRAGYVATCSCSATLGRFAIRAVLEEQRAKHLRKHAERATRTVELPDEPSVDGVEDYAVDRARDERTGVY